MIVTLHGLGAPQTIMMGKAAVDLAEERGYILVAPMGYNVSGWYGSGSGSSRRVLANPERDYAAAEGRQSSRDHRAGRYR